MSKHRMRSCELCSLWKNTQTLVDWRPVKVGMPCFVVNTKLGTAMIDSVGGPVRVNNLLSTLNIPTIGNKNMKRNGETCWKYHWDSTGFYADRICCIRSRKWRMCIMKNQWYQNTTSWKILLTRSRRMSFARCLPALKSIHQSDATVTNDSEWSDLYNCD